MIRDLNKAEEGKVLDIYFYPFGENTKTSFIRCDARRAEIECVKNPHVKLEKTCVWNLLEYAYRNSFGIDPSKVNFRKMKSGKWTEPDRYFSLSHSDHMAAAAVSNAPCGIDVEEPDSRISHFSSNVSSLLKLTLTKDESARFVPEGASEEEKMEIFMRFWTRKESIFKFSSLPYFEPSEVKCSDYPVHGFQYNDCMRLQGAFTADNAASVRFFLFDGEKAAALGESEIIREEV